MKESKASKNFRKAYYIASDCLEVARLQDAIENNKLVVPFEDGMNHNLAKNIIRECDSKMKEIAFCERHGFDAPFFKAEGIQIVKHSAENWIKEDKEFWARIEKEIA